MKKNSALEALKRAQQALSISSDDSNLKDYVIRNADKKTGAASFVMQAIEVKYIPQFDSRVYPTNPKTGEIQAGSGYRTRFFLADGTTIGTFSQAAYEFFKLYAALTGNSLEPNFCHIDIVDEAGQPGGTVGVEVKIVELDKKKSTYEFAIIDEGSNVGGASTYLPQTSGFLALGAGVPAPTETPDDL